MEKWLFLVTETAIKKMCKGWFGTPLQSEAVPSFLLQFFQGCSINDPTFLSNTDGSKETIMSGRRRSVFV